MKAQKNTISENIKQALLIKPMTRKEIIRLVVTDFRPDSLTDKEYNETYKTNLRGYYSAFFTDCKHFGNIEKIKGKWHITKACLLEGNGLWSMNKDRKIEILTNRVKNMSNQWQEIRHLNRENKSKADEIFRLNKVRRVLEDENNDLRAERKSLEENVLMYSGQSKRYAKKLRAREEAIKEQFECIETLRKQKRVLFDEALEGNETNEEKYNEIIIKINLAITK